MAEQLPNSRPWIFRHWQGQRRHRGVLARGGASRRHCSLHSLWPILKGSVLRPFRPFGGKVLSLSPSFNRSLSKLKGAQSTTLQFISKERTKKKPIIFYSFRRIQNIIARNNCLVPKICQISGWCYSETLPIIWGGGVGSGRALQRGGAWNTMYIC